MGVVVPHLHGDLVDDGPVVDVLVDEVDRRPRHLDAVVEGLLEGVQPPKCRQEGGMDVDRPPPEAPDELRREDPHVPGEDDEVDPRPVEVLRENAVVPGPVEARGVDEVGLDPIVAGDPEGSCVGVVREDDRHLRWEAPRPYGLEDVPEVLTAPRGYDPDSGGQRQPRSRRA